MQRIKFFQCRNSARFSIRRHWRRASLATLILVSSLTAQAADSIVALPFENVSRRPEYHWIGESFALLLGELLDTPGLTVISTEERNQAYERIGLKNTDLLTRAAAIRIAGQANANLAVIGDYDVGGEGKNLTVAITARLIETREGRLVGNKVFNYSGPLMELQAMQGQLAWNILYERDPAIPYPRERMVTRARAIPPKAFESYVKGTLTADAKLRENFLRRAVQEYDSEIGAGSYAQAVFELGVQLSRQQNFTEAAALLSRIRSDDVQYLESQFHLGLAAWGTGNQSEAANAFGRLVEPVPIIEVLNNAGAFFTARGEAARAIALLQRAVTMNGSDLVAQFNLGYAFWKNQNYAEAIAPLQAVVNANNRDGEAFFLLAKSLAASGKQIEADQVDQNARRHLGNYALWQVQPEKIPSLIRIRTDFNRASFLNASRRKVEVAGISRSQNDLQQSLSRAREFFETTKDEDALGELQKVLAADSTSSEAHLLRGKIYQRRGETENAISALSAAVYWNPRLTNAHVVLGQIYFARGDRARALAHGRQAIALDPQDREAIALMRKIESER